MASNQQNNNNDDKKCLKRWSINFDLDTNQKTSKLHY